MHNRMPQEKAKQQEAEKELLDAITKFVEAMDDSGIAVSLS